MYFITAIVFFMGPLKYIGGMWIAIGAFNGIVIIKEIKNKDDMYRNSLDAEK